MTTYTMFNHITRAYNSWKSLGKCHCAECGIILTRSRATRSLFCESCFEQHFAVKSQES
jgi:hypothetical protein